MSQGSNLDAFPIRALLEVVERVMSYGVIIQVSFPHKCGKFNWCRALNVEVIATFLDISPFHYLHDPGVFHRPLLFGVGSYIRYS